MIFCEAIEVVKKAGIKISEHKTIIVTASNSIYLDSEPDPLDTSERFYIKGDAPIIPLPEPAIEEPVKGKPKK